MLRPLFEHRRLWGLLALASAGAIALGSLLPGSEMPRDLPWDKLNHFLAYGVLAALSGLAGLRARPAWLIVAGYGVAIEFAQIPVPGRLGGDPYDILANALGAAIALLLLVAMRRFLGGASGSRDLR